MTMSSNTFMYQELVKARTSLDITINREYRELCNVNSIWDAEQSPIELHAAYVAMERMHLSARIVCTR